MLSTVIPRTLNTVPSENKKSKTERKIFFSSFLVHTSSEFYIKDVYNLSPTAQSLVITDRVCLRNALLVEGSIFLISTRSLRELPSNFVSLSHYSLILTLLSFNNNTMLHSIVVILSLLSISSAAAKTHCKRLNVKSSTSAFGLWNGKSTLSHAGVSGVAAMQISVVDDDSVIVSFLEF